MSKLHRKILIFDKEYFPIYKRLTIKKEGHFLNDAREELRDFDILNVTVVMELNLESKTILTHPCLSLEFIFPFTNRFNIDTAPIYAVIGYDTFPLCYFDIKLLVCFNIISSVILIDLHL